MRPPDFEQSDLKFKIMAERHHCVNLKPLASFGLAEHCMSILMVLGLRVGNLLLEWPNIAQHSNA